MAELKHYVATLREDYQKQFGQAALDYLKAGLHLFHQYREQSDTVNPQAALGNLSISVELMLKAFIASKNLMLLFKGLPLEARVLLICPDSLPDDFQWRPFDIEIRSAKYKTLELSECISIFFTFFPQYKQALNSHLKLLSTFRNASVHHILPEFHKYELERTAFVALRIHDLLQEEKTLSSNGYVSTSMDNKFRESFREEKIERVRKEIEKAKIKSKEISGSENSDLYSNVDWENFVIHCPVCKSLAFVFGYTESHTGRHGDEYLSFYPYSFFLR